MAYADKHEIGKAIEEYNTIIQRGNISPNVYHNLANAYHSQHKYNLAEKYYLKAIETQNDFHFSYNAVVEMYMRINNVEKLSAILQKLARMGRGNPTALYAVARGYEFVGNTEKAQEYYAECCNAKTQ